MMKTKIKFLLLIISIAFNLVLAQDKTEYTLTYNSLVSSPKATLNDVAWIAGYWRGKAFDGVGGRNMEFFFRKFNGGNF